MIVGFHFTKINAERKTKAQGKINVNNNVVIKTVEPKEFSVGDKKQNAVSFTFEFTSTYDPEFGKIILEGEVIHADNEKNINEMVELWNQGKKIQKELMGSLLNAILTRCNVQALIISQQLNLPSPIPLPKVNISQKGVDDKPKKKGEGKVAG